MLEYCVFYPKQITSHCNKPEKIKPICGTPDAKMMSQAGWIHVDERHGGKNSVTS
jgi:hypothetical protein